jgi:cyclopropane fatty-acyl-phospholipid synthase-like methyltransferase
VKKGHEITIDLESLHDWHYLLGLSKVITAAHVCGLIDALRGGEVASAATWAERIGWQPRGTTLMLDVLSSIGWVERNGERYGASSSLLGQSDSWLRMAAIQPMVWRDLPRWLRTGEALRLESMDGSETVYSSVALALAEMSMEGARVLASRLGVDRGEILDVGCGAGPWSLAMAEDRPDVRVSGLDHPDVVDVFRRYAERLGVSDRVQGIGGDMFEVELDEGRYDVVVIGLVLRIVSPERARALVERMSKCVAPGGAMVIVDAFPTEDPVSQRRHAIYALHLAIRSADGEVHDAATVGAWLEEAGLTEIERMDIDPTSPINALIARRPAADRR